MLNTRLEQASINKFQSLNFYPTKQNKKVSKMSHLKVLLLFILTTTHLTMSFGEFANFPNGFRTVKESREQNDWSALTRKMIARKSNSANDPLMMMNKQEHQVPQNVLKGRAAVAVDPHPLFGFGNSNLNPPEKIYFPWPGN